MRRDDRQPFDIEAHEAADITQQFWGTSRGWDRVDQLAPDDEGGATGALGRSGRSPLVWRASASAATAAATGRRRRIDRTRSHGIRDPSRRQPLRRPRRRWAIGGRDRRRRLARARRPERSDQRQSAGPHPTRRQRSTSTRTPSVRPASSTVDERDRLVPVTENQTLSSRLGLGAVDPLLARLGAIVLIGVLLVPLALSSRGGGSDAVVGRPRAVAGRPGGGCSGDCRRHCRGRCRHR